jgi:hypothetical protein
MRSRRAACQVAAGPAGTSAPLASPARPRRPRLAAATGSRRQMAEPAGSTEARPATVVRMRAGPTPATADGTAVEPTAVESTAVESMRRRTRAGACPTPGGTPRRELGAPEARAAHRTMQDLRPTAAHTTAPARIRVATSPAADAPARPPESRRLLRWSPSSSPSSPSWRSAQHAAARAHDEPASPSLKGLSPAAMAGTIPWRSIPVTTGRPRAKVAPSSARGWRNW